MLNEKSQEAMISIFVNKIGSKLSPEALKSMNQETSFIHDLQALSIMYDMKSSLSKGGLDEYKMLLMVSELNSEVESSKVEDTKVLLKKSPLLLNLVLTSQKSPSWGDFCWESYNNISFKWGLISKDGTEAKLSFIALENNKAFIALTPENKAGKTYTTAHALEDKAFELADKVAHYGW